jgi:hypothetical protein
LSNTDKHQALVPSVQQLADSDPVVTGDGFDGARVSLTAGEFVAGAEIGRVAFYSAVDPGDEPPTIEYQVEIKLDIAFGEPELIRVTQLRHLRNCVVYILNTLSRGYQFDVAP